MISTWMLYIVISSSSYVINIDSQDTPSSQWLVMKQVVGVEPTDTYEISTDEIAEFEQERANEY